MIAEYVRNQEKEKPQVWEEQYDTRWINDPHFLSTILCYITTDGFGGLVVSMLASGTQVCGFKPGRSRWILRM